MTLKRIDDIALGQRVRKDMGDLAALSVSMRLHGLLHPIVISSDGLLIAGHRRLEAARLLGWEEIPVTVIEVQDLLSAERDENEVRKNFTPSEAVAIGLLIEERERSVSKEALRVGGENSQKSRRGEALVKITNPGTRERVAAAVGMSGPSYTRAKQVVAAAEADPTTFGDLPDLMDQSGNISGTHREMQRRAGVSDKGRHPILRKKRYPQRDREVQRSIWTLDGVCAALDAIPIDELDASKRAEWVVAIKKSISSLSRIARRLGNEAATEPH